MNQSYGALTFIPAGTNVADTSPLNKGSSAVICSCRLPLGTVCAAEVLTGIIAAQQVVTLGGNIDVTECRAGTGLIWVGGT